MLASSDNNPEDRPAVLTASACRKIKQVAAGSLLIACLSTGCAGTDLHAQLSHLAMSVGKPMPLAEILQKSESLSSDELKSRLHAILSEHGTSEENRREAAYVLARILQKSENKDDLKEANSLFEDASHIPALWERCQWHVIECATGLGDENQVRKALEALARKAKENDNRAGAEYALAQSYLRGGEKQNAREAFASVRKNFPKSNFALGSAYYLGEMDADYPEHREEVLALFREYLKSSPDGHFARDILKRLDTMTDYEPTQADRALFGQVQYLHGEWQQALENWKLAPPGNRWYAQAICLLRLKRTQEAKQALFSGIKEHPADRSLPDAARKLCDLLTHDEAVALWTNILSDSPKFGDVALWNLAIRSSPPQSISYYQSILTKYPQSDFAPESAWWVIWDQVQNDKIKSALDLAVACEQRYPHTRPAPRFAFWAGKLHERLKDREAAKAAYEKATAQYPSSYYGWRSRARLQALSGGKDSGWLTNKERKTPDENWSWPEPLAIMDYAQLEKRCGPTITMLIKLHQWDESLSLLSPAAGRLVKSSLLAMVKLPLDAINTASADLSGKPSVREHWQMAYPLMYSRIVAPAAKGEELDPLLVHALIREESRYNQMALSRSKAIGLMQLMPGTAYGVAKRIGISLTGIDDIYKPENNIRLGTSYLAYVVKRHQGSALLGVASYNGGPNAAQSWANRMKKQGYTDWDVFVENIPFKETREYVRKVFASYWNYQAIYPPGKK